MFKKAIYGKNIVKGDNPLTIFLIILFSTILIIAIILRNSYLKVYIKDLKITNKKINKLNFEITLELFNKIKYFRIRLSKEKVKRITNKKIVKKILNSKLFKETQDFAQDILDKRKEILKIIKEINLEKINFYILLGTENPCITAYSVAIISSAIAIILARMNVKTKYKIEPVYIDRNYIYLSINCIISIKLAHIISIFKQIVGKEVQKKNGETSNRRTYANSNG